MVFLCGYRRLLLWSSVHLLCYSKITATIEPDGKKCAIDVRGVVERPSSIPPHMSKLATSTQSHTPVAGTRTKLKCAPQVLKFAGVELNDRRSVLVVGIHIISKFSMTQTNKSAQSVHKKLNLQSLF